MGRPPCCDKEGVKKGPWTPEEDILLVSYIQEHGPGNWRAVPTNTGLISFFFYVLLEYFRSGSCIVLIWFEIIKETHRKYAFLSLCILG